ncbi:MAG: hypothetical protein IKE65_06855 [Clostridia bacterium]|nr:hypothetical protein [Clostridia bacterium]
MKYRVFALVLCVLMLFSLLPMSAAAAETVDQVNIMSIIEPKADAYPVYEYAYSGAFHPWAEEDDPDDIVNGVLWIDITDGWERMLPEDKFIYGHTYEVWVYVEAEEDYVFSDTVLTQFDFALTENTGIFIGNRQMRLGKVFAPAECPEHDYADVVLEPATTAKDGLMCQECTICGATTALQAIPHIAYYEIDETSATRGLVYNGKIHNPNAYVYARGENDEEGPALIKDVDYTVSYPDDHKVGSYKLTLSFKGKYAGEHTISYSVVLGKPSVKARVGTDKVVLEWNKVAGAQFYRVWGLNLSTGKYELLAKTTKCSFTKTGRKPGTRYVYAVRACFTNKAGKEVRSSFNADYDNIETYTLCKAPAVKASVSGKTVTLKWAKCAGTNYYKVYKYNTKTKKYTTVISATALTDIKLSEQPKGTSYYLVRAYNKADLGSKYTTNNLVKAVMK